MDIDVSTEEPPTQAAPEPPPQTTPQPARVSSPSVDSSGNGPALVIIGVIIAAALAVLVISHAGSWFAPRPNNEAYRVEPYTPPSQFISSGDHVLAHEHPDSTSPGVVMFGPGVALTITGRVSRGFGNDWYAIVWNGRTAFIRQQDAASGAATAPPPTAPHVIVPPREPPKPNDEDQVGEATVAPPPPAAAGSFQLSGVRWASRPNRRDVARAYPSRALYENQSGHVTLDCIASGSGALDCSVAVELPSGYGFGRAAMDLSRQFRLEPTTSDGRSVAGGHISVPVEFRAG